VLEGVAPARSHARSVIVMHGIGLEPCLPAYTMNKHKGSRTQGMRHRSRECCLRSDVVPAVLSLQYPLFCSLFMYPCYFLLRKAWKGPEHNIHLRVHKQLRSLRTSLLLLSFIILVNRPVLLSTSISPAALV